MLKAKITADEFDLIEIVEVQELYTEDGDGFALDVEGFTANDKIENTDGLKSALEKTRDERTHWKSKFRESEKRLESYADLDPAAIKQSQAQLDADRKTLAIEKTDSMIRAEMLANGVQDFMFEHVKAQMDIAADGTLLDPDGAPLLDESGDAQTVATFCHGMRGNDRYKGVVRGTGHSGSDTQPSHGGERQHAHATLSLNRNRSGMTTKQKVDYIKVHGEEKFLNLPA